MNTVQEFVGGVKIRPVWQETVKTSSGGMVAVSSGIIFFWLQSDKTLALDSYIMLGFHAFAIPLLVAARVFYSIFDSYDRISARTEKYLLRIARWGVALALAGYVSALGQYSYFLVGVLVAGIAVAMYLCWQVTREPDGPHMVRRL